MGTEISKFSVDLSLYEGTVFNKEKLQKLSNQLIEYERAKQACGGKHHSQWMDMNLILSHPTPIRNLRQALAHIERSYQAVKETEYKIKKLSVTREIKLKELREEKDALKAKMLEVEIEELDWQRKSTAYYFEGALKTIQTYIDAYEEILSAYGLSGFDEIDFETQEEEYHLKTALLQSMRSMRASGRIDMGNQEYLERCGVDPLVIERIIRGFLMKQEHDMNNITNNLCGTKPDLSTSAIDAFLQKIYEDCKGYSIQYRRGKGIRVEINKEASYIEEG